MCNQQKRRFEGESRLVCTGRFRPVRELFPRTLFLRRNMGNTFAYIFKHHATSGKQSKVRSQQKRRFEGESRVVCTGRFRPGRELFPRTLFSRRNRGDALACIFKHYEASGRTFKMRNQQIIASGHVLISFSKYQRAT